MVGFSSTIASATSDNDYTARDRMQSVSNPNVRISLRWDNLTFENKTGRILDGISGDAHPGEIIAVIGGSGLEKTSLLNVLSGRISSGTVTGNVLVNGKVRKPTWKNAVGYVELDDTLYSALTVRETIAFSALLRLPYDMPTEEKMDHVEKTINSLGLSPVADTRIGNAENRGISGGERKRVSIAVELVTDPRMLFLDGPTNGLDAMNAQNLIETLKGIAKRDNHTFVLSIDQPRANILNIFTRILLISGGRTIFYGNLKGALEHFKRCDMPCPALENPADFFVDQITVDLRSSEAEIASRLRLKTLVDHWEEFKKSNVTQFAHEDVVANDDATCSSVPVSTTITTVSAERMVEAKMPCPWPVQFYYLLERNIRCKVRDRDVLISLIAEQALMLMFTSFVFFQLGTSQFSSVQNRLGLLGFIPSYLTFSVMSPIISSFTLERPIILRERYSASYKVSAFLLAKFIALLPSRLVTCTIFSFGIYYICGLRVDSFVHFLKLLCILSCLVVSSTTSGLCIAAIATNVEMASICASLLMIVTMLFAGSMANSTSVTWILRWIRYLSSGFYALNALTQNEMNGLTLNGVSGNVYVQMYGLNILGFTAAVGGILGIGLAFYILAYFALLYRTKPRMVLV